MAGETILVVDDERTIQRILEYNLRKQGYQTESASDGVEALQRVRERKQARDQKAVRAALESVRRAAVDDANLMPPIIAAVQQECTVGEISDVFREAFGVYRDPAWI